MELTIFSKNIAAVTSETAIYLFFFLPLHVKCRFTVHLTNWSAYCSVVEFASVLLLFSALCIVPAVSLHLESFRFSIVSANMNTLKYFIVQDCIVFSGQ